MAEGEAAIDLEAQDVEFAGRNVSFDIDPDIKYRLMNGLDDIGMTFERAGDIDRYEQERERPGPVTTGL
jgi:3-isopropylmalate/(R)-2-methylmalate dehydratase small subunit